ncbi:MAG: hypothetical protein V1904_02765 [Bacteroidota bacterium]
MKAKQLLLILVAFLFVTFTGCKKYEDGPTISVQLKSWRVENTWKEDEYIIIATGVSVPVNNDVTYEFKGGGDYIEHWGSSVSLNGSWEFGDKKETIKTTISGFTDESKILRLKSSELWVEDMNGIIETHYVSAD